MDSHLEIVLLQEERDEDITIFSGAIFYFREWVISHITWDVPASNTGQYDFYLQGC